MNEFEQKFMVTEKEYQHLLMLLGQSVTTTPQINYYYDTDDLFMNRQNVTCRIRLKNNQYQATMKIHIPNSDCSTEIELATPYSVDHNVFTAMGLEPQGMLMTERTLLLKNNEFEIVLDQNKYLGVVDYELEIEYLADQGQDAATLLRYLIDVLYHEIEQLDRDAVNVFSYLIKILQKYICLRNRETYLSDTTKTKSQRFFQRKWPERRNEQCNRC